MDMKKKHRKYLSFSSSTLQQRIFFVLFFLMNNFVRIQEFLTKKRSDNGTILVSILFDLRANFFDWKYKENVAF